MSCYRIAAARERDLALLPAIELAAAKLLDGHAPPSVLNESTPVTELAQAMHAGCLWVALEGDAPVGFAHVTLLDPTLAHLAELDVHPDHGRRGLGRALVNTVCEWAEMRGLSGVTLTTFRRVPFNMPFYARVGFEEIPASEVGPALARVLRDEVERGLDAAARVAMRRWNVR